MHLVLKYLIGLDKQNFLSVKFNPLSTEESIMNGHVA